MGLLNVPKLVSLGGLPQTVMKSLWSFICFKCITLKDEFGFSLFESKVLFFLAICRIEFGVQRA